MKQILKLGFALAAYTVVACIALALVNNVTSPVIAANQKAELDKGLKLVFAQADTFETPSDFSAMNDGSTKLEGVYLAKKNGKIIGVAVQATGPTYDKATVLVGVNTNRTISSVKILAISDTSGYGQNATKPEFYGQFAGKSIDDKFSSDEDIDGLTGASITRKGIAKILKASVTKADAYLAKNGFTK